MVIAVLIFILFLLDFVLGFPFSGASPAMDIGFVICSAILGYMSLSAFWEAV
jgi:hypothetical protein